MEQYKKEVVMKHFEADTALMLERINSLRLYALNQESHDYLNNLSDKIFAFDQDLQVTLRERYGDENLRKMVPEWHKLVGSTVEDHEANPEAKQFVVDEIKRFVEEMEEEWELVN